MTPTITIVVMMLLVQILPGMWRGLPAAIIASFGALGARLPWRRSDGLLTVAAVVDHRLDEVLEAAGAALHECNLNSGEVRSIVGPIDHIAGWTAQEWRTIGHQTLIHPDDITRYWIDAATVTDGQVFDRVARFRHRDGGWVWLRDVSRVSKQADGSMSLAGMTLDVTTVTEALASAEYRGTYDQLTGLPNRFTFLRELESRLGAGEYFAVLLVDLNRFRDINDALTHAVGDEMLIELADRLDREVGPDDLVARLSGDQFGVLYARPTSRIETRCYAERLVDVLTRPMALRGMALAASISIGSATREDEPVDVAMMMRWADIALAEAKQRRLSHVAFRSELETATVFELLLAATLPEALAAGQIVAYFQPKVDLTTGRVVAAEALTRWENPDHGLLGAGQFAHLTGVGHVSMLFTETMIDQGLQAIAQSAAIGCPISVAVNISARSLLDIAFPERIERMCRNHGVSPSNLVLELTEDEAMESFGVAPRVMQELAGLGIELSIDDFGTGYSSFARLPHLPISEIKVDRQFVTADDGESSTAVILNSIIQLGRGLGHRVVAEGIETEAQADRARSLGADVGQGFLFGRAMPLAQLIDRLQRDASVAAASARVERDRG